MDLDLAHQVGFDFKLLGFHLRLGDRHLFTQASDMLFYVTSETSHLNFDFLHSGTSTYDLRQRVTNLPLYDKLIVSYRVIASQHLLRALNDLIFEDIKPLLKLSQSVVHLALLLSKLRVLVDLHLDLVLDVLLNLCQVTLCVV